MPRVFRLSRPIRLPLYLLTACIILSVVGMGAVKVFHFLSDWLGPFPRSFDRQVWLAHARSSDEETMNNPRLAMQGDVLRLIEPGMAETAAVKMLGKPSRIWKPESPLAENVEKDTKLINVYPLGVPYIDPIYFCVPVTRTGKVGKAYIYGH